MYRAQIKEVKHITVILLTSGAVTYNTAEKQIETKQHH